MENREIKKKEILSLFSNGNDILFGEKIPNEIIETIKKTSIPDEHIEEWSKTDLNILLKHNFIRGTKQIVPDEFIDTFSFYGLESDRIVFVNWFFLEGNSKISQNKGNVYLGSIKKTHYQELKVQNTQKYSDVLNRLLV